MQHTRTRSEIKEELFLREFISPAGKILILSGENFLKAIYFSALPKFYSRVNIINKKTEELEKAAAFFNDYFAGVVKPVSGYGINFDFSSYTGKQIKVYRALLKTGFGKTLSYGELASKSGFPHAARFVGSVMARNNFPVIIPCHRVVRSDGTIGEYSGGKGIKEFLLRHEGSFPLNNGRRL